LKASSEHQAGLKLAQAIRNLLYEVEQPVSFKAAGIAEDRFFQNMDSLCEHAQMDSSIATTRRIPGFTEMKRLFENAYYGNPVDF
jgi:acetaldehyde dehydrogenase/alcohol dehydrogenase